MLFVSYLVFQPVKHLNIEKYNHHFDVSFDLQIFVCRFKIYIGCVALLSRNANRVGE